MVDVATVRIVYHFCVWIMLGNVMAPCLRDEDIVVIVLLESGLAFRCYVLISRFCVNRLNIDWFEDLAFMQLFEHIWLHLENQISTIDVDLRGPECS